MSRNLILRRAGVLALAVTAGILGVAAPAAADVTVSPPSAPQGSGANVTFTVTNSTARAISKVTIVMPPDTPVAEVFPLSVDDWAPLIENRKLATPLTSIHGGTPVTETAASITWVAVRGKSIAPGSSADLPVALGPLPQVSRMSFPVRPTYADGRPGPDLPPATLTLTPAVPGRQAPGHAGHGGPAAAEPAGDDAAFAALVAQADQGPGFWSIAGWVLAALAGAAAVVALLRGRRRSDAETGPETDAEPAPAAGTDEKEPVGAGAKASAWRYRDGS